MHADPSAVPSTDAARAATTAVPWGHGFRWLCPSDPRESKYLARAEQRRRVFDAIVKDLPAQPATHPQGAQVKGELGL